MEIRKATASDLSALEALYERARAFMAAAGNPTQWGKDRPDMALIREDIILGRSYVCCEDGEILAAFMFDSGPDPFYAVIDGQWPDDEDYTVMHRVASGGTRRGAGQFCIEWCIARSRRLRMDTHEDNIPMRRLLEKLGFKYCGVITTDNGTPRLAYCRENEEHNGKDR